MLERRLGVARRMPGASALRMLSLMVGGYLVALAVLSGAAPFFVSSLLADSLVARALGVTLVASGGSLAWVSFRTYRGLALVPLLLVSLLIAGSGIVAMAVPSLLALPAVRVFPMAFAWMFGVLGLVALSVARWYAPRK